MIGTATNTLGGPIALPRGSGPNGIAITPDGTHAYVANQLSSTVSVIATAVNTLGAPIALPAGSGPDAVAIGSPPVPALQVTPATGIVAAAAQGATAIFSAGSFDYQLSATTGSVKVSISISGFPAGIPAWLNPSFTSAALTTTSMADTFSLINLGALSRGTYNATIAFTNTTNGQGNTTRTANLRIYDISIRGP